MPKVSVIVPVYGVERYIERCVRSLFEQTLDDMEFIFVDDCTKDNSIQVLKKVIEDYPNRKEQIKILHHEHNKGLSHARETGVNAASGEYIAHCDSDDWVHRAMYDQMYNRAKEKNYDFLKSGFITSDGINESSNSVFSIDENYSKESVIRYLLHQTGWNTIWNTLVKRELYNDIEFTDFAMLEDHYVVTQLLLKCRNIGIVNESYYYYFENPESICHTRDRDSIIRKSLDAEKNARRILGFIHTQYGNKFYRDEPALMIMPRLTLIPIMDEYDNYKVWNKVTPGITWRILCCKYINPIIRLWYVSIAVRIYPIYKFIRK